MTLYVQLLSQEHEHSQDGTIQNSDHTGHMACYHLAIDTHSILELLMSWLSCGREPFSLYAEMVTCAGFQCSRLSAF